MLIGANMPSILAEVSFINHPVEGKRLATESYRQRLAEVDAAIRAESARWGDNRRRRPYTRGEEWIEERDRLLERWFPRRTEEVLGQLEDAGWLR